MQSVHMASGAVRMNAGDAFVCAGVESMSRVPMGGYNPLPNPSLHESFPAAYISMGETAENVAERYRITREEQEAFALESQRRAAAARAGGRLDDEIVPVETGGARIGRDGCIREDTSLEGLADLKPAFMADGTVTAGTSSPPHRRRGGRRGMQRGVRERARDGAAGAGEEHRGVGLCARGHGARAGGRVAQGAGARRIGAGDVDVVELNEAFASQAIACMRDLGLEHEKVNLDGGAIALGHPPGGHRRADHRQGGGASQARGRALLKREGGRYALATQCIGGGQGIATVLEAVD